MFILLKRSFFLGIVAMAMPVMCQQVAPGMERLFVLSDVPEDVRFDELAHWAKEQIDEQLPRGEFHPSAGKSHITFFYVGDIPSAQVPAVLQAITTAIDTYKERYGAQALEGLYGIRGGRILDRNAVVVQIFVPRRAYDLYNLLEQHIVPVTGQRLFDHFLPHVTLGRCPEQVINYERLLVAFLPIIMPPVGARGPADAFSITTLKVSATDGNGFRILEEHDLRVPGQPRDRRAVGAVAALAQVRPVAREVRPVAVNPAPVVVHPAPVRPLPAVPVMRPVGVVPGARPVMVHRAPARPLPALPVVRPVIAHPVGPVVAVRPVQAVPVVRPVVVHRVPVMRPIVAHPVVAVRPPAVVIKPVVKVKIVKNSSRGGKKAPNKVQRAFAKASKNVRNAGKKVGAQIKRAGKAVSKKMHKKSPKRGYKRAQTAGKKKKHGKNRR